MGQVLLRLLAAFLLLSLQAMAVAADTAAGIAAYNKEDYETARNLLKPEAERGDPEAQVKYGLIFAKGLGVRHDGAEAFKWFQKASDQGNVEAFYCMGVAFDTGDAGATDRAKAATWYRKAAERGYAKGQYNLAVMLQYGDGVPTDIDEGIRWLQKAAEQSYPDAEGRLAYDHIKGGFGVEQNLLAARYWAARAVQHGDQKAKEIVEVLNKEFIRIEREDHLPRTAGGDGSSLERAIQLPDETKETTGVSAEYAVLHYFYPGYSKVSQALQSGPDDRPYDVLIVTKDGQERQIYFDISNFFGNME